MRFAVLFLTFAISLSAWGDEQISCRLDGARKAIQLKAQVDSANQNDLKSLYSSLDRLGHLGPLKDWDGLRESVLQKLARDKDALVRIKAELDSKKGDERGSPALRTSLVKLIGAGNLTGILDDAAELLKGASSLEALEPGEPSPSGNRITVLKTLLVYLNDQISQPDEMARTLEGVRMLYPAKLPASFSHSADVSLCRVDSGQNLAQIMVPNAGYIFGGEFIGGVCRGIDCSTFVSYCSDSSVRLSTMVMEYTWRDLMKREFSEKEKPIRDEFLEKWGMREALKEYEAVDAAGAGDLKPGDVIVWRWSTKSGARDGHALVFLDHAGAGENRILAMEANRADDKSREGIMVGEFDLRRPGIETYVLRRKK